MKKTKNMLNLLMLSSCIVLTLSACNKDEVVVETTPVETVDEFAVNQQISVDNISVNESLSSEVSSVTSEVFEESVFDNNPMRETELDGIVEESLKAEIDESLALQESEEYEIYVNSDERIEIYMTYDRTEGDNLVVYYMTGDGEDAERVESLLKVSSVTEGIDELNQGDDVCIICNGAVSDDGSEFLKVFKVINVTKELESLVIEESLAEDSLDEEEILKVDG